MLQQTMYINDLLLILQKYSDILTYFEIIGSYANPFIHSPRDFDAGFNCPDLLRRREIIDSFRTDIEEIDKKYSDNITAFITNIDEKFRLCEEDHPELLRPFPIDAYAWQWSQIYYLEENKDKVPEKHAFDVLGVHKEKYKNAIKRYLSHYPETLPKLTKALYHIVAGLYILKENSYDLTEEEINNINIIHDKEEGALELFNQILSENRHLLD